MRNSERRISRNSWLSFMGEPGRSDGMSFGLGERLLRFEIAIESKRQHLFCRPKEEDAFGNRRSGQGDAAQLIRHEHGEFVRGGKDENITLFAREIKPSVSRDGRCAEALFATAEALFIMELPRLQIEARHNAIIQTTPEQVP